jgi:hypothetical protein
MTPSGLKVPATTGFYTAKAWLRYLRMTDRELLSLCRVDICLGSGKGGQKRNKTANAIRLTFNHLAVTASKSRSQSQNRHQALWKLRLAIAVDTTRLQPSYLPPTLPPTELIAYLNGGPLRIAERNSVLPMLLGFFLDQFIVARGDWQSAAVLCRTSRSQLQRFVERQARLKTAFETVRRYFLPTVDG